MSHSEYETPDLDIAMSIYKKMHALITNNKPIMFKVNSQSREWLDAMKNTIRADARQGYPCGCDYPTSQVIANNSAASAICEATCAAHGGWNGQWTNANPAAPKPSVCGCNTCPIPSLPAAG